MLTLVRQIAALAEARPGVTALVHGKVRWTYSELHACICRARAFLLAEGIPPGSRVALLVGNSPQYVGLLFGVHAARCVAVPLNVLESVSVLARQVRHCGAGMLFVDSRHRNMDSLRLALAGDAVTVVELEFPVGAASADAFRDSLVVRDEPDTEVGSSEELACIIYTSGTTGNPKGVMLSHRNLASNAVAISGYLQLSSSDVGLCVLPFHFSYGNSVLTSHLYVGARLVIEDSFAFPQAVMQRMEEETVTGFSGVPSTYAIMLSKCNLDSVDLKGLRYLTQAGGPMPWTLVDRLRAKLPHARLFVMYGQTEATARLTYLPPHMLDAKRGSVGLPIDGVQLRILGEAGDSRPCGASGEVCAQGPNVMMGYWSDAAATANALAGGWLHTGDRGHLDADGYLYLEGRETDMIKVGAFRVSPAEIEEAIASLPEVQEVAVLAMPDELLGQAVKAVVVLREGSLLTEMSIKAHCRRLLATYKVPKSVVLAAELPKTASGKIQRFKLA